MVHTRSYIGKGVFLLLLMLLFIFLVLVCLGFFFFSFWWWYCPKGKSVIWPPFWNGTFFSFFQICIICRTRSMVEFVSENSTGNIFWNWVHKNLPSIFIYIGTNAWEHLKVLNIWFYFTILFYDPIQSRCQDTTRCLANGN